MSDKSKERLFELALITVGIIGLLIAFTVLFAGPKFIFNQIIEYFNLI